MKQLDLMLATPIQRADNPAVDSDRAKPTDASCAQQSEPAVTAAKSSAVWKPTFKEFLYAHRLAPKVTSQR